MVIAITGGRGFIGRHLARELSGRGKQVRVLDRTTLNGPPFPWGLGGIVNVELMRGDICDRDTLGPALRGATAVVHLAGFSSVARCREHRLEAFRVNALGTANVLDAARETGVRRVIVASSTRVAEAPGDGYALTKAIAEEWTMLCAGEFAGSAVVVRLANVYGPGQAAGAVVADFLDKAANGHSPYGGDGTETVSLVYVGDVVAALAILVEAEDVRGVVTVAGGEEVALVDLARRVAELAREDRIPVPLPPEDGPSRVRHPLWRTTVDSRLAGLGWGPRLHWTQGIRHTWEARRACTGADVTRTS